MVPSSLVSHVSKRSVDCSAAKEGVCSENNDEPERIMTFQLGDGEEEEASSFVPSSIAGSRVGRPVRWSMEYLRDNVEGGCGKILATGNFGETGPSVVFGAFSLLFCTLVVYGVGACTFLLQHICSRYLFSNILYRPMVAL